MKDSVASELGKGRMAFVFDSTTPLKELEGHKTYYKEAKLQKRYLSTMTGVLAESFQQCIDAGGFYVEPVGFDNTNQITLHIIDQTGDRRVVWDARFPDQVKEAAELYQQYIDKGWKAYAIHRLNPNQRGLRIHAFDAAAEEIIFDDRNTADLLKNFDKAFTSKEKALSTSAGTREKLNKFAESFHEIKMLPRSYPG